jgi:hypothetical protein
MKLSILCLVLGLGYAAANLFALLNPKAFTAAARKFPRDFPAGVALILMGTAWFEWYLWQEQISDFAQWKPVMQVAFAAVGLSACWCLRDFLAVRGLAVVMLLLAKLMLDTQRWHDSPWKNVVTVWAYLLVIAGMWLVVSPWRLRDWIEWHTATEARLRLGSGVRLAFGVSVAVLGLTVLRG